MANRSFDVIVVGVGAMGSAACHHLARRGSRVLGLERFDIPHAMGSSHGINRIIRLAYYEDPSYVPLLRRAYELWREQVNAKGGLDVAGTKRPVEFVQYDDQSNPANAVRVYEKLITADKVDLLLAPWGTPSSW